jgi:serine protease AprX
VPALLALGLMLAAVAPAQAAPLAADLDRDGVFDDLEASTRVAAAGDQVRVLVTLRTDATAAQASRLEQDVPSLDVTRRFGVVDAFAAVVSTDEVRRLAAAPGVDHVEADATVHATNASAALSFGVTEARLDVPGLDGDGDGSVGTYSAGDQVAAVIDTGIYTSHTDLDGGKVLAFQDFTDGSHTDVDTAFDDNGHGTHVAGTIAGDGAGDGRGVAPGAGLVGLKVLNAQGSGSSSNVIAAIDWVWNPARGVNPGVANGVTYGIEAINLSLGSSGCVDGTDAESVAVNNAAAAGYVVAVAAGNDGPAGCTNSTGISSPAAAADAITVGAMADVGVGGFYLADFSSRGPTLDGRIKPDIVAPGVAVTSAKFGTTAGYVTFNGTSMATPFVAGVALLMRDLNSALTPPQVKQRIMQTAVDWGSTGPDSDYGAGRLDAYAALAASAAPTALTTPPTGLPTLQRIQSSLTGGAGATRTYKVTGSAGIPLTVGLTVGNTGTDFDMYLTNPAGTQVAEAETPHRQDELHLASGAGGPYTLRVVSFSGSGAFFLDVSGGVATENLPVVAPSNTALPLITGLPAVGNSLGADAGGWTGVPAFEYSWQRCTAAGADCVATGAQGTAYPVTLADAGRGLRLAVTATNAAGSATAHSPVVSVPVPAPVNLSAPGLTGDAREGLTVGVSPGAWDGLDPLNYSYTWERCDGDLANCSTIDGATAAQYALTAADIGSRVRAVETATNPGGSASAASSGTPVVAAALRPPSTVIAPSLAGTARHGRSLRLSPGEWAGTGPVALRYEWLRCAPAGGDCEPIEGASDDRYVLTSRDVGSRIAGRVVASNADGGAHADTASTAVVRPAPPALIEAPTVARSRGVLRVFGGAWWGSPELSYRVRWLRCSASGSDCDQIRSASGAAYVPAAADVGHRLRARVIVTGPGGTYRRRSEATSVVYALRAADASRVRNARRLRVAVAGERDARPRTVTRRLADATG